MKKAVALTLVATMICGYLPQRLVQAAGNASGSTTFDEDNTVLKMGVMSDLHLAYAYDTSETMKQKVENYAKAVGTLEKMSGDGLDVLMLAGDYTGYGTYEQGKTFASATKAILDTINANKEDKTQLFFTYGNHDTEWNGQMSYTEWEALFDEFKLLEGVEKGPENAGCYKYTKTVDRKTYYFFSVETEQYNSPSNTFRTDVLEWLDKELAATPKDAYAYVVSHGPIKETGVYGSDMKYDKNADWGTAEDGYTGTVKREEGINTKDTNSYAVSSNINTVLEKYPQVMYFSGHTHYTNALESTIMSDKYTAITVSQFTQGDLYNTVSNYLDANDGENPGYSLYVEVDKNGNQRITRVDTSNCTLIDSVTVTGTAYENAFSDPTKTDGSTLDAWYTENVAINYKEDAQATTLEPWIMQSPTEDGAHLTKYSAAERCEEPTFNAGNLTITPTLNTNKDSLEVEFTFPTASCTNSYVIRYEFTICDKDGNALNTRWILGNWTTNTDGVTEEGKTHKDATTLTYKNTYSSAELAGVSNIYATLTAVNEFGGRTTITSDVDQIGIMKPSAAGANENLFDNLTDDRIYIINNTDGLTKTFDEKGNAKVSLETSDSANSPLVFDIAKEKSATTEWGMISSQARKLTDIKVEDTFVYQTDFMFEKESEGKVAFVFRTADTGTWQGDRCGVYIWTKSNCVRLKINNEEVAVNYNVPIDLNKTYTLRVVSTPEKASVWIDDECIFYDQYFHVTKKGDGTANSKYDSDRNTYDGIALKSLDMIPVIACFVDYSDKITVSNQYVYLYNQNAQVSDALNATNINLYGAGKVNYTGSIDSATIYKTSLDVNAKYDANSIYSTGTVNVDMGEYCLKASDTVITEFDVTASGLDCGSDNSSVLHDIEIRTRKGAEATDYINVLTRFTQNSTTTKSDLFIGAGTNLTWKNFLSKVDNLHYKIVSTQTQDTIYIDGTEIGVVEHYSTWTPCMEIIVRNGHYTIENISVRKEGAVDTITALTDSNNLLNTSVGDITSSFKDVSSWEGKSESVVSGNNFYADLTYTNLVANGVSEGSIYVGEVFYPFGKNNANITFKGNESFMMSALVRVSNQPLDKGNHRVGMNVANYNGENLWYFISGTTLYVYKTRDNATQVGSVDLNKQIGYQIGDTIRLATAITPYGFDIYIDGNLLFSYTAGDGTNVRYNGVSWTASGVEAYFLDATAHYNVANIDLYKDNLNTEVRGYETLKGVYAKAQNITAIKEEIADACNAATDSQSLWKYVGVIGKIVDSGKVVNNMIADHSANLSESYKISSDCKLQWESQTLPLFFKDSSKNTCPFTTEDAWVIEADIKSSEFLNTLPRFGIQLGDNYKIVMFQCDTLLHEDGNGAWTSGLATMSGANLYNNGNGQECHIKFEINKTTMKITVSSLDGDTEYVSHSIQMSALIKDATANSSLFPCFYSVNATYDIHNLYVGYNLEEDVKALNTAVAKEVDFTGKTWASEQAYKAVLEDASAMNTAVQTYVDGMTGTIYTTPYSKAQMNAEVTKLANAETALVNNDAIVTVGDETIGNVAIGLAEGDALPTGYVQDKYITGWTLNNESAETYSKGTEGYVAEYIDRNMLDIMVQGKANSDDNEKRDIRFISSVNTTKGYKRAGLVFSLSNHNPTEGGTKCTTKSKTKVYSSLIADGVSKDAKTIYGNEYSQLLFAHEYTKFSTEQTVYVRAFVQLADDTIIYGDVRKVLIADVQL